MVHVDCGDWRLGREIGRGAYGVVYLATNGKGERAAVKVCRRSDVGDERYERELRGTKLYSSIPPQEGLVRMRVFAEESWGFYAVMDLADDEFGGSPDSSDGYRPTPSRLRKVLPCFNATTFCIVTSSLGMYCTSEGTRFFPIRG